MSLIEALILGIVQGLTEFLPVSSSGHIELGKAILGIETEEDLTFSIVVHAATVCSTLIIFRQQILDVIIGVVKFKWNEEMKFFLYLLVSMIPVTIVGLFFKDAIEPLFNSNLLLVGICLIVTAVLLYSTTLIKENKKDLSFGKAFLIGLSQAAAVLPGISRSGATISTGLLLNIDRAKIASFSFLMVIPPILGITILDLKDVYETGGLAAMNYPNLIIGFIAAFATGLAACKIMIELVKRGKISYFAIYCLVVGVVAIIASCI